jgi:gas vesicle protein
MDSAKNFLSKGFIFLLGGLLGTALGLLYAPRAGKRTRQLMATEVQEVMDRAMSSIRDVQETALSAIQATESRMEALSQETKDRLLKLQEIATQTLEEQKQSVQKGYSKAKKAVKQPRKSPQS